MEHQLSQVSFSVTFQTNQSAKTRLMLGWSCYPLIPSELSSSPVLFSGLALYTLSLHMVFGCTPDATRYFYRLQMDRPFRYRLGYMRFLFPYVAQLKLFHVTATSLRLSILCVTSKC